VIPVTKASAAETSSDLSGIGRDAKPRRIRTIWFYRLAAALLIGVGLAWLWKVGPFAIFITIIGDCFENCDGYMEPWVETARYAHVALVLGQITAIVALAAMMAFRPAQIALAAIAGLMLASSLLFIVIGLVIDLSTIVIPGADVFAGHFAGSFIVLWPSAFFWLGGAMVGMLGRRLARAG
jgi:hypothetical protein